jgi:hypothetical protein
MSRKSIVFTFALVAVGFTPVAAFSGPDLCPAVLAKGTDLAAVETAGPLIEMSAVDQHGNRLVVPDPRKKRPALTRLAESLRLKEKPVPVVVTPQKAPLDYKYFLTTFRPELEVLLKSGVVVASKLGELDKRLLSARKLSTGDEFYILRLDTNLDQSLEAAARGESDLPEKLLVFSVEPYRLYGRDKWTKRWEGPERVKMLSTLGGTTSIDELIRFGLAPEKKRDWTANIVEVFRLNNRDRVMLNVKVYSARRVDDNVPYKRSVQGIQFEERKSEAPEVESLDDALEKYGKATETSPFPLNH